MEGQWAAREKVKQMADIPLFNLDADGRWRLAYDDLQWILQRRGGKPHARSSGFTGVSFIATKKQILMDVIREKAVALTPEATDCLDGLPDTFKEFVSTPQEGPREARKRGEGTQTPEKPIKAPAPALESVDRAA